MTIRPQKLDFTGDSGKTSPVQCLGITFESEEARRAHFQDALRAALKNPAFRATPGFPVASDDDILQLSDPPYYTACPNPFLEQLLANPVDNLRANVEPYVGDFDVDSRNPVYLYHPYHTKVPPEVIATLIEHYTQEGDVVLDVFAGSGMAGVAAAMTGRRGVVVDLSPVASFISAVNTSRHPVRAVIETMEQILSASKNALGWLYETTENGRTIEVDYFVRTDVFTCPECTAEFPFFPHGVIHHGNKVETRKAFPCPGCGAELNVRRVERVLVEEGKKSVLAWVKAGREPSAITRAPNAHDMDVANRAANEPMQTWHPDDEINPEGYSAKLAQLGAKKISDVSKLLSPRNLRIFSELWSRACAVPDPHLRRVILSLLTSSFTVLSERQGYFGGGGGMSGNMYMPIVRMERNPWASVQRKLLRLKNAEQYKSAWETRPFVSNQSATCLDNIPSKSVDYIYTDPPFGANIIYSEMNLILEGWLRLLTNASDEAVVDDTRERDESHYSTLMRNAFRECYRVLRPGHWITVEFHNTKASIWNLIQTALGEAGFVVAQVGMLNKGSTTILADIRPHAAKHDLLISAYKPTEELASTVAGKGIRDADISAKTFVRERLAQIPEHTQKEEAIEKLVEERLPHVLYDRFLAYHVNRGFRVPMSSQEFIHMLATSFPCRDKMYFLPAQVLAYEQWQTHVADVDEE